MRKTIASITILIMFLVSCSTSTNETVKNVAKNEKYELDIQFKVEEFNLTFHVKNNIKITNEQLDKFKEEIEAAVLFLGEHFPERIKYDTYYVYLERGREISYVYENYIYYYRYLEGRAPILHELTHAMLGSSKGTSFFTIEGLAVYFQNQYEEFEFPSMDTSIHQVAGYFVNNNKYIPLNILMDEQLVDNFGGKYSDELLRWMGYIEAGSFTEYLIEEYGLEMYMKIYDQPELNSKIEEVYKKPLSQLEKEWLNYLQKNSTKGEPKLFSEPYDYFIELNEQLLNSNILELIK
ncbi:hypothetical protein [Bacillus solimangrovi]|uniref:DUF1570 domain-containing protein n=1 Tax=Bacillus solimangrovi TaxID=1305675 RepID=A0A1E5LJH5_9BACI|nr:hypothetical protein [Bacillus solimangrovi]OEH94186.1 hypothetical protein BFG57_09040 [Bacillus solimangrovi]